VNKIGEISVPVYEVPVEDRSVGFNIPSGLGIYFGIDTGTNECATIIVALPDQDENGERKPESELYEEMKQNISSGNFNYSTAILNKKNAFIVSIIEKAIQEQDISDVVKLKEVGILQ